MHAILIPFGSYGDVHPFVGLGRALRARGHRVTVITSGHFEPLICRAGLEFVGVATAADYDRILSDPDLWHPRRSFRTVALPALEMGLRRGYELIEGLYEPGNTVVAAAGMAFGARIAQEKLGIPLATVHLQPLCLLSAHETPVLPGGWLPRWVPSVLKRLALGAGSRWVLDRIVGPITNAFRAELGLPPTRDLLLSWWHSPQRVVGFFPDWFGPPQPDWPPQTRLVGFPLYDERETGIPDEARTFLDAGEPPILFTPGSAMRYGGPFFAAAMDACRRLGRRGIFLTRYREQLPPRLSADVRHFDYLPLSTVLPRAAALVHHGGIGTAAQGLAAGVPQLTMPMAHDQPDNADRLRRLGVGASVPPRRFHGPIVARALDRLLGSAEVAAACRTAANRFHDAQPLDAACHLLEELVPATPTDSGLVAW